METSKYVTYLLLAVCAFFLFYKLGHYPLWDDEANTALFAHNVWRTGDTNAYDGNNLIAYGGGGELQGMKNRVMPPLQYFIAAPFLGILGRTAFAARFPFAFIALLGFCLLAYWLHKARASRWTKIFTALLILGNVSFFLFSRQARYYAVVWSLALLITYLYVYRHESLTKRVLLCVSSLLLLLTHFYAYGMIMVCLAADYLLFKSKTEKLFCKRNIVFLSIQTAGVLLLSAYVSTRTLPNWFPRDWLPLKLTLLWKYFRDLNGCEFFWFPTAVIAVIVAIYFRDRWLLRALLALVIYTLLASLLTPTHHSRYPLAPMRYMTPIIPLGIFITVRTVMVGMQLQAATVRRQILGCGVVVLLAFTTLPHALVNTIAKAPVPIPIRSTLWAWFQEFKKPQRSAYGESVQWLSQHFQAGARVLVTPDYGRYPLMFHAPQFQYIWQLLPNQRKDFPSLPSQHFFWNGVPDVIVAYGGFVWKARWVIQWLAKRGERFEAPVRLNVLGPDDVNLEPTRPELHMRQFYTVPPQPPRSEGTYFFKRVKR